MSETGPPASDSARWTVLCNITTGARGGPKPGRTYFGTPKFSPGTKLYTGAFDWGGQASCRVIGLHRKSRRFINCWVTINVLTKARPQLVCSPATLRKLERLRCTFFGDRDSALLFADHLNSFERERFTLARRLLRAVLGKFWRKTR